MNKPKPNLYDLLPFVAALTADRMEAESFILKHISHAKPPFTQGDLRNVYAHWLGVEKPRGFQASAGSYEALAPQSRLVLWLHLVEKWDLADMEQVLGVSKRVLEGYLQAGLMVMESRFPAPKVLKMVEPSLEFVAEKVSLENLGEGTETREDTPIEVLTPENEPLKNYLRRKLGLFSEEGILHDPDTAASFTLDATKPEVKPSWRRWIGRATLWASLCLLGFAVFYLVQKNAVKQDLVTVLAKPLAKLDFPSPTIDQARTFVLKQFGLSLSLPAIEGATVVGIGRIPLDQNYALPIFVYTLPQIKKEIRIAPLSYAQLDVLKGVELSVEILKAFEEENKPMILNQAYDGFRVIIWRWQHVCYFAFVPEGQVKGFMEKLYPI